MRNLIKISIALFFSLELILPSLALAKQTAFFSPILMDKAPAKVKELISERLALQIYKRYSAVKTAKDFDNLFLRQLSEKDRQEVLAKRFPIQEYPSLAIRKNTLTFKWKEQSFNLEITEFWNNKVRINGKDWVYSDRISTLKNVENLENFLVKLTHSKTGSVHFIWQAAVPEANATPAIIAWAAMVIGGIILGSIVTGAQSTAADGMCAYFKEKKNTDLRDYYIPGCTNYFNVRDAHAKEMTSATSVMDIDKLNELLDKYEIEPIKCPGSEVKDFVIKTRMRRSEINPESIPQTPLPAGNILSTKAEPFITGTVPVSNTPMPSVKDGVLTAEMPFVSPVASIPVVAVQTEAASLPVVPAPIAAPVTKESLRAWSKVDISVKAGAVEDMTISTDEPQTSKAGTDANVICRIKFNADGSVKSVAVRNSLFKPDDGSSAILEYGIASVYTRTHESESGTEADADLTARQVKGIEMSKFLNERIMKESMKDCRRANKVAPGDLIRPTKGENKADSASKTNAK